MFTPETIRESAYSSPESAWSTVEEAHNTLLTSPAQELGALLLGRAQRFFADIENDPDLLGWDKIISANQFSQLYEMYRGRHSNKVDSIIDAPCNIFPIASYSPIQIKQENGKFWIELDRPLGEYLGTEHFQNLTARLEDIRKQIDCLMDSWQSGSIAGVDSVKGFTDSVTNTGRFVTAQLADIGLLLGNTLTRYFSYTPASDFNDETVD